MTTPLDVVFLLFEMIATYRSARIKKYYKKTRLRSYLLNINQQLINFIPNIKTTNFQCKLRKNRFFYAKSPVLYLKSEKLLRNTRKEGNHKTDFGYFTLIKTYF
jgi:hypothetical protein